MVFVVSQHALAEVRSSTLTTAGPDDVRRDVPSTSTAPLTVRAVRTSPVCGSVTSRSPEMVDTVIALVGELERRFTAPEPVEIPTCCLLPWTETTPEADCTVTGPSWRSSVTAPENVRAVTLPTIPVV